MGLPRPQSQGSNRPLQGWARWRRWQTWRGIFYIYKYVLVLGIDIRFGIDIRYILVFCTTWHVLFCILYVVLLVVAMMEIVTWPAKKSQDYLPCGFYYLGWCFNTIWFYRVIFLAIWMFPDLNPGKSIYRMGWLGSLVKFMVDFVIYIIYIHTYIYTYTHVNIYIYTYNTYIYIHLDIPMYIYIFTFRYTYVYIYI
jgi:hypothetical protein